MPEETPSENLTQANYYEFISLMTHAIIAVTKDGGVIHAVFYDKYPSEATFEDLAKELRDDEELGLANRDDYELVHCPPELFRVIKADVLEELRVH